VNIPESLKLRYVSVHLPNDYPVGGGFLARDGFICTCAHVVAAALGDRTLASKATTPESAIKIRFPYVEPEKTFTAKVHSRGWSPDHGNSGDIAVLELSTTAPSGAMPTPLLPPGNLQGRAFAAFGYPKGRETGREAHGVLAGAIPGTGGWVQMQDDNGHGVTVQAGFSGAPVWAAAGNNQPAGVAGIIVAQDKTDADVAFLISREVLARACPDITPVGTTLELMHFSGPRRPRVFISHWAEESSARKLVTSLQQALWCAGFDTPDPNWIDHSSDDTDESASFVPLALAHVAVLVLSPRALTSVRVRTELSMLADRVHRGDRVTIVPVLVGVARASVESSLLKDWEKRAIFGDNDASIVAGPVDATVQQVIARITALNLGATPYQTALEKLASAAAQSLGSVKEQYLANAEMQLSIPGRDGLDVTQRAELLIFTLWESIRPENWTNALDELTTSKRDQLPILAELLKPAWVPPVAAHWVASAAAPGAPRAVLVNATKADVVAPHYLSRAYCKWEADSPPRIPIAPFSQCGSSTNFIDSAKKAVQTYLERWSGSSGLGPKEVATAFLRKGPIFVVVPELLDETLLAQLQKALELNYTVFMLDPKGAQPRADVIYATPRLREGEELDAVMKFITLPRRT
jgi:hypothetical protein